MGNHVTQAGSLVSHEYLRFDFTHFSTITKRELLRIEELVNENIMDNIPVEISEKTLKEAKKEGAMALFGEKYGNVVRMVKVGDVSKELCGGTHTKNTGEIGLFKILKEESVGSGIRRIEAVTAHCALDWMNRQVLIIDELCEITKSSPDVIKEKIIKLQETIKIMEKEEEKLKSKVAGDKLQSIINQSEEIKEIKIISGILSNTSIDILRVTIDNLKSKFLKGIFILGSSINGKTILIIGITKNLTPALNAGIIIKEITGILGGKGGGRPDLAEAGGTEIEKLGDAISHAVKIVKHKITNFVVD
ncbi:hypothetical protein HY745_00455 [Candidatus Desantisbacteria bacterium]|nr:hypothetical protein [Candidatus Desantisbacteria bacterium]